MSFTNTVTQPTEDLLVINSIYSPPIDFAAAVARKKFKRLHVYGRPRNFGVLSTLTHLVELRMQSTKIQDFSILGDFNRLEVLIYVTGSLRTLDLAFAAKSLTNLWISGHRSLTDVGPIEVCKNLKELTLRNLQRIARYCDLKKLPRLEFLALWKLGSWPSLQGLKRTAKLQRLFLDQTHIKDGAWEVLLKLKQLRFISGMEHAFGKVAAAEFRKHRPEVEMIKCFPAPRA